MMADKVGELGELFDSLRDCSKCGLAETRTNVVFGCGSADAQVMFVGEAPGHNEDLQGEPFVGAAGRLLDEFLKEMLGMRREDVYIANVIKCRPPENRAPTAVEIDTCKPFLLRQVEIVSPKIICALGNFAMRTLTDRREGITKVRRKIIRSGTRFVFPMFHPAAALHRGDLYEDVRMDFAALKRVLDSPRLAEETGGPETSQMELF
ncbi:MAG: uracil-DNA glycosylase [bacterium]